MAILQGIEVMIVPVKSQGQLVTEALFEELGISPKQKGRRIATKDQSKETKCFLRVAKSSDSTRDMYFAIRVQVLDSAHWLKKSDKSESVSVEVIIDGGSLVFTKLFKKKELAVKRKKYINKFLYDANDTGVMELSAAQFEKRNDNTCDIRFTEEPGETQGHVRKTKQAANSVEPSKGVSKKMTGALLKSGVTLFAAPDLNHSKVILEHPNYGLKFVRSKEAVDLRFAFAYRKPACLFEGPTGLYSSKGPILHCIRSPKPMEPSFPRTPTTSPVPPPALARKRLSRQARAIRELVEDDDDVVDRFQRLSTDELAEKKRRLIEDCEDDEEMDRGEFKKQKREQLEGTPDHYEINATGLVDLTRANAVSAVGEHTPTQADENLTMTLPPPSSRNSTPTPQQKVSLQTPFRAPSTMTTEEIENELRVHALREELRKRQSVAKEE